MNTAQPIRNEEDLFHMKNYYQNINPNKRNYLLIVLGLNTALRISDILKLSWGDVYDFERKRYRQHIFITEQKTDKCTLILINQSVKTALTEYKKHLEDKGKVLDADSCLFESYENSGHPISRVQAYRIIKKAADECGLEDVISCHSLRKTFGYHAWKQGIMPVLLMNIYNHSSFQITTRYLGIEQDDRDRIFHNINL